MRMKIFLNYFSSKMILLNILQNFAIYLFKYFVSHIMITSRNDTFLYYRINQISLCCIVYETLLNPIVNKCVSGLDFSICYFQLCEK